MLGESPIRLINNASIEGLEIPVTDVKNNAPKSFVLVQSDAEQDKGLALPALAPP